MEPVRTEFSETQELYADPLPFARSYQMEALEKAIKQNTIVFLETGSGKTLIAIMLLRSYAYLLRKPSPYIAVFLVPTVVLVNQQAEAVKMHTDLKVGKYWGEMGVDYWDAATWKQQKDEYEVLVMTPMILLDALRHSFLKLDMINVLIFDECHNARGRNPYACIMKEFYHHLLNLNNSQLPRIFGMTASLIKAKGCVASAYWQHISELENLMNSKVYTVSGDSVLANYIPFSTTKLKMYNQMDIPTAISESVRNDLLCLRQKYENACQASNSAAEYQWARKKISKLFSTLCFCLDELGVWLAFKAAEYLPCKEVLFTFGQFGASVEATIVQDFLSDAFQVLSNHIPSGPLWSIGDDICAKKDAGYLSSKVICLIESLLNYSHLRDLRCIVFVERVITAIVLKKLLSELLPERIGWKTEYTAGNNYCSQTQSRKEQNRIVEDFRNGTVNIIVATSILEEGLDVQRCNLVVRFDPSSTVCSFIQSRGRARMQNSDFLIMVGSGDSSTLNRVRNYIASGDIMRAESLRHASLPCTPLDSKLFNEVFYRVESTGAVVTLSSSVSLIYFYCSRLPCDGYFKPSPRCEIDKELKVCKLNFPKSCPIQTISVEADIKILKQLACLEACKQLHQIGALTDNLVPDIVVEEAEAQESGYESYADEQKNYVPRDFVSCCGNDSVKSYHCYVVELGREFEYDVPLHHIVLAMRNKLEYNDVNMPFGLEVDRGSLTVQLKYMGELNLKDEQVLLCQRFQVTLFRVLLDHNLKRLKKVLSDFPSRSDVAVFDYLLLPCTSSYTSPSIIDWKCVSSVLFPCQKRWHTHTHCSAPKSSGRQMHTKNGLVCLCTLENCLVYTPHNGHLYSICGTLDDLNGNSLLHLKNEEVMTYKQYFKSRHGIDLLFEKESLLKGKNIFPVLNYVQRCRQHKEREPSSTYVELPPELCFIVMSPFSIATLYSFSFVPSILHRIECLLIAGNLRNMHLDQCTQNVVIPTAKVLEAITTKKCQEKFHLESLETLGDSFLKYAVSQQLFKNHQNHHEGLLSLKREKIISNAALCKLGCDRKIPGFIRNEPFDPKTWIIPGDQSGDYALDEELLCNSRKIYSQGNRKIRRKTVADVVEALIGVFLTTGGEAAALSFMDWLGIKVDLPKVIFERQFPVQPEKLVNVKYFESLLNYSFRDASLLVEALTHGSYMLPEIPGCYQRLEFLGDSVLDYAITLHLYQKYPGMSPGLLTDLRSASVNNDCYAQSAVKFGLHKHILHASQELHRHIVTTVQNLEQLSMETTFGWESETAFPKVLGDIIESLAGAVLVDSGYNKDIVLRSIMPLLEPMVTPETAKLHPVRELHEFCQKEHYIMKKDFVSVDKGVASITIEIEANGVLYKHTCTSSDKKTAKKLASKAILKSLKDDTRALV